MADVKELLGAANQAITVTLASLASTSSRQSAVVDNTANLFMDVKLQVQITTASSGVSATGAVNIFAYATADGTNYSGAATGSDAAHTANKDALVYLGSLPAVANSTAYNGIFSLARAFGYGGIPAKWGIVVENLSGAALAASGNSAVYQGISAQVN